MSPFILSLHLVLAGLWLGCVLTEVFFERALLGKGPEQELTLAALHRRVDLFIEVPVFIAIALTGGLMLPSAALTPVFVIKIAFALLAILANIYCVRLVCLRHRFALAGDWTAFARIDHLQHKIGALVLLGILAALGIGLGLGLSHRL